MAYFEQDFIMRQIQQLTQLLQQIIFKKKQNKHEEARQQIQDALQRFTAEEPKNFNELSLEETHQLFKQEDGFQAELAVAIADLLAEQGELNQDHRFSRSQQSYTQALLLYRAAAREGLQAMPVNLTQKIKKVEGKLQGSGQLEEITGLINEE